VEYAGTLTLRDESTVITPVDIIPAFECLEMIPGHRCIICNFLSSTIEGIEKHSQTVHEWDNTRGTLLFFSKKMNELIEIESCWTAQTIQTFFLGIHKKYFAVTRNTQQPNDSTIETLVARMLDAAAIQDEADDAAQMERDIVMNDQGAAENSPWLTMTGWKEMFAGKNMAVLVGFINKDVRRSDDYALKRLHASVHRLINYCMQGVRDLDWREWKAIRYWMRSHKGQQPSSKPFRRNYKELSSYADVWLQLILLCWRVVDSSESLELESGEAGVRGPEFLPEQKTQLMALRSLFLENPSDADLDKAVLIFSVSLIEHRDYQKERSIIKYFCGIYL